MIIANQTKKSHRIRKSSGGNEVFKKQKKARNAARPKQRFVGESVAKGGLWTREPIGDLEA